MRLPSRALAFVWAVLVFLAALAGAFVLFLVESPAATLEATRGPALERPPATPAPAVDPAIAPTLERLGVNLAPGFEHTRSFAVAADVRPDGSVRITETIVQDFASVRRHGIERVIPLRDEDGVHKVSDLVVSTSEGTPGAVTLMKTSDQVTIRIGDADVTITGPHTYRLEYTLAPATLAAGARESQLRIDAISAWRQQIDELTYTVTSPGEPTSRRCFEGELGTRLPCATVEDTPSGAVFRGDDLRPFDTFTVRLTWPRSVVAVGDPVRPITGWDWAYAAAVGLAVGLVAWAYRRRWVRLFAAGREQLWATFGPDSGGPQTESFDLTEEPAIEFVPPMGLRPGEMGVLTEASKTEVLTATVIDLAARGALKVTESGKSWDLDKTDKDVALTDDEQRVMTKLFSNGTHTSLAGRRTEMGGLASALAEDLTDDLEDRGLAVRGATAASLDTETRGGRALFLGLIAVVVGCFAHAIALPASGSLAMARVVQVTAVGLVLLTGGLLIVQTAARHLTPLGVAALWRVRGFERFFRDSEAMHARAAADAGLLRQYMGYAIVFGHVREWIAAFEGVDTSDWFDTSGPLLIGLSSFTSSSNWTPPSSSSSSGFGSGGGGGGGGVGGGGGGSW